MEDREMVTGGIEIYLAWWFDVYAAMLAFVCAITGTEPDEEKVAYWAMKAIRMRRIEVES